MFLALLNSQIQGVHWAKIALPATYSAPNWAFFTKRLLKDGKKTEEKWPWWWVLGGGLIIGATTATTLG
jgi:hypothetical protein